MGMLCWF